MYAHSRERFSTEVTLTPADVAAFARAAGDPNPVHHDPAFAAGTRYGRLIASGTQTSALLMGLTASHFSTRGAMVGIEFWFPFRRAVLADETVRVEWLVVKVTPHARLGGDIVDLRGRIRGQDGQTAVGAKGRVLVTNQSYVRSFLRTLPVAAFGSSGTIVTRRGYLNAASWRLQ